MNLTWTEDEKAQLLDALQKYGGSNLEAIASTIKSKSVADVQNAIFLYERAAMSSIKDKNLSKNDRHAPIDDWLEFFKSHKTDTYTMRDVASALKFIALYEERNDTNLTLCYEYLAEVMNGKAPKQLPNDALQFLMNCFKRLGLVIKYEDNSKEIEFLKRIEMKDVLQKTYLSKKGNIVGDPNLNLLKVPLNLLKMKPLPEI